MKNIIPMIDKLASKRNKYIKKNIYYHNDQIKYLKHNIEADASILEIGCGTGYILKKLPNTCCTGLDLSEKMIVEAKKDNPKHIEFICANAEIYKFNKKFDYILISDTLSYIKDIQNLFHNLKNATHNDTRVIINYHNFVWFPILKFGEIFNLKMPQPRLNWIGVHDINNLLNIEGFDIIKCDQRLLIPLNIPIISILFNKIIIHFPFLKHFSLSSYIIARTLPNKCDMSVSVIIPARNEEGNIESAITRMPQFGSSLEIIFIEGGSTDNTMDEIKRVANKYSKSYNIKYDSQNGKGKGDAVRKGYDIANNDILMILDADLTVPPEDLPKFYNAIVEGKGEFINGTRLVYPLEKDSMRFLNILGNKFFSLFFSWLLNQNLKDTLCGTKVLTKKNWLRINKGRSYFGEFDPFGDFDLLFGASKLNLKITEIPIRYQARNYGDTNISRFSHGWLLLKMSLFALFKLKLK